MRLIDDYGYVLQIDRATYMLHIWHILVKIQLNKNYKKVNMNIKLDYNFILKLVGNGYRIIL